ncbi:MAG: 30S ribosomal protein S8 [Firmicutes bacterium]|nr:30S ribosomal protein S8 [Bacillota bacterium]
MAMTDPIADMLTRIRNASHAAHPSVDVPASRMKKELARVFKEEGYVRDVEFIDDKKQGTIRIYLRYGPQKKPVLTGVRRISKPGRRVYVGRDEIPRVLGGLGVAVISTSQGIMTDREARKRGIGGEVLFYVW